MQKNCLIVQSGGPTAVINNSVIGLVDEILKSAGKRKIYGAKGGINGLLRGDFIDLSKCSSADRNRLRKTPGSALGTSRHQLTDDDLHLINKVMRENSIKYLFYIGGNGSMAVANKISKMARRDNDPLQVIGIPTSVDNDLTWTDHSLGYGSAAKFIAMSLLDMKMDVESYMDATRIIIVETMGRNTGWLAASASLIEENDESSSELLIYLPEVPFDKCQCIEKVMKAVRQNKSVFLVVAEGIKDKNDNLVNHDELKYNVLGSPELGGVSSYLKEEISRCTGHEAKVVIPSIWQRSSIRHAAKVDVDEAYQMGKKAWQYALEGYSNRMLTIREKYYSLIPFEEVAGKEKNVPIAWYDANNQCMKKEFIEYVTPLIQGELSIPMKNGLPTYPRVM